MGGEVMFDEQPDGDIHGECAEEIKRLEAENTRLTQALRYEQHLAERIGTHGPDCWAWGPAHYECLMREYRGGLGALRLENASIIAKLAEARELLKAAQGLLCLVWEYDGGVFGGEHNNATDVSTGIDAWLERNKT